MAQVGSALRSGRRGRRFKSCYPDSSPQETAGFFHAYKALDSRARLGQHSGKEDDGDEDDGKYPCDGEGYLEVLAHLTVRQSQRQPQCWRKWGDEGSHHVADNESARSAHTADAEGLHRALDDGQYREVIRIRGGQQI